MLGDTRSRFNFPLWVCSVAGVYIDILSDCLEVGFARSHGTTILEFGYFAMDYSSEVVRCLTCHQIMQFLMRWDTCSGDVRY